MGSREAREDVVTPPESPEQTNSRRAISSTPANFDSRVQWGSLCPSVNEIRDQGNCGCCWAFGAVNAMTDRYCIANNGASNAHFSAQDVCSCCSGSACGGSDGCQGGYASGAWGWAVTNGVVTGGNCATNQVDENDVTWCTFSEPASGCSPYSIPECTLVSGTPNATWPLCGFHVTNGVVTGSFAATLTQLVPRGTLTPIPPTKSRQYQATLYNCHSDNGKHFITWSCYFKF